MQRLEEKSFAPAGDFTPVLKIYNNCFLSYASCPLFIIFL
jgi:hypothetical protein